jgi:cell division protein ZapA
VSETADTEKLGPAPKEPSSPQSVKVEIYNQSYFIRGKGDSEYIVQLAEYVDQRMREIVANTSTVDSLKVAILSALHIADEFHQLKKRYEDMDAQLEQKTSDYSEMFDEVFRLMSEESEAEPVTQTMPGNSSESRSS